MLKTNLGYFESREERKLARANHIMVTTTYSQDGRSLEYFYIDYSLDGFASFLFEDVLNASSSAVEYTVYDAEGSIATDFNKQRFPKRV